MLSQRIEQYAIDIFFSFIISKYFLTKLISLCMRLLTHTHSINRSTVKCFWQCTCRCMCQQLSNKLVNVSSSCLINNNKLIVQFQQFHLCGEVERFSRRNAICIDDVGFFFLLFSHDHSPSLLFWCKRCISTFLTARSPNLSIYPKWPVYIDTGWIRDLYHTFHPFLGPSQLFEKVIR